MSRVIWTTNSLFCLERLYKFLKDKNANAAKEAIKTIKEGVDVLESSPYAGKPIEYMNAQFRIYSIPFGKRGYIVLYKNEGDNVFIMSVKHYLELEFII